MTYESQAPSLLIEQWKPLNPEGKKQYDREFLLDFQFVPASIQKPEGLPPISDVVLDKVRGEPIKQVRATFFNLNIDPYCVLYSLAVSMQAFCREGEIGG